MDKGTETETLYVSTESRQKLGRQSGSIRWDNPRISWLVLAGIMILSAAFVGGHLRSGWVPHDDGLLGQGALRVFNGQLPHRDFTEIYTGGLNFIHAVFFYFFGVNLLSLRISVFLFFLAWLPAVFYISLRFGSHWAAGAVTFLAAVWTLPNYPAAMPSWYNLFFATFGAAALLRYLEIRSRRWLFVAGICGGISVLIKIIGAYYIAGALLFFVLLEQESDSAQARRGKNVMYRIFIFCSLAVFLYVLISVTRPGLKGAEIYHFILPSATITGLILLRERYVQAAGSRERFVRFFQTLLPFVAGIAAPILIFLIPYIRSGSVHTIFAGVYSSASTRAVALAIFSPVLLSKAVFALPLGMLIVLAVYWDRIQERTTILIIGLLASLMVPVLSAYPASASSVWCSASTLTPLIILIGAVVILHDRNKGLCSETRRRQILLLLPLAGLCSLVQFPFPVPIYFCYTAPLTLFAILALVGPSGMRRHSGYVFAPVLAFYIFFAVRYVVPACIYELTRNVGKTEVLHLPRAGGIKVEFNESYEQFIGYLQQQSPNGLMLAANDCAELYFLSGLTNPTLDDGGADPEVVLKAIQSPDLKLVVINEVPFFPGARPDPTLISRLVQSFPSVTRAGGVLIFRRP